MAHQDRLANARVLIFGATSGIGFAVTSLCVSAGAQLFISGSSPERLSKTVTRLQDAYPSLKVSEQITTIACDLADQANLEANLTALFETVTNGGTNKLNHIVFTAGDGVPIIPTQEITVENASKMLTNIRFLSPLLIGKLLHTGKYMDASPTSSFTITGGVATEKPRPGWLLATMGGSSVRGLTLGLAKELQPIRVNLVEPGAIMTELWDPFFPSGPQRDAAVAMFKQQSLTGTVGEPHDTAESYAYLMRDAFITGSFIKTNGGILLA